MLKFDIIPPCELADREIDGLCSLMQRHYSNLDAVRFRNDLAEKTSVILIKDSDAAAVGFSTVLIYDDPDLNARILYSGDTIIHKDHWGSPVLFYGFGSLLKKTMNQILPGQKAYWFLLSKGYRTYIMLPLFFKTYWPSEKTAVDESGLKKALDILSIKKFGALYDRKSGLIAANADYLNEELSVIPENKLSHPTIRFFLDKNPGYTKGTELACLTEIRMDNIQPPALRFVR